MPPRPAFLTAIGWFLVGGDGVVVFAALLNARHPSAHSAFRFHGPGWQWAAALGLAGLVVRLLAGLGALRGWSWSRFLYGAWVLALGAGWLATGVNRARELPFVGELVGLLVLACLFTAPANRWFRRAGPEPGEAAEVFG